MMDARSRIDRVPPAAQVLAGMLSVQVGAALAKQLFPVVGSLGSVALRLFFAAIVLVAIWRPSPRLGRGAWPVILAYGLVLGGMNLSFYLSLTVLPLGVAVTTTFLGPLAVAVGGSRRWIDGLWALPALAGVLLLAEGGGDVQPIGIALALVTASCWAAYILLSAALGRRTTDGGGLAIGMVVAMLVVVPIGVAEAGPRLLEPWVLLAGLGVALLSSVIPYSLELEALRRMPPKVFGVLMSLEPAIAALIGLLLLGEVLAPTQWLAVFLVVAASVGATRTATD
jgi:inner membrane transporter RhtA